jgi:hypothetical protein
MVYIGLKANKTKYSCIKLNDGLDVIVSKVLILNVNFCSVINKNGLGWTDSKKTEPCHFESKPNRIEPTPNRRSPNFDLSCLFSYAQVEKVGNPKKKKVKNLKEPIKNKTESCKIESNPSNDRTKHEGDILRFKMNL